MVPVNPELFDCIVAGSGPAGAMCAQTLVEAGQSVLMLDGGLTSTSETALDATTLHHYKTAPIAEDAMPVLQASLAWTTTGAAEQLTLPRKYVFQETEKWLPVRSSGFQLMESLAYGGLGAAWGLGCYRFTDEELKLCRLPQREMSAAYETVAQRIGIAYTADDIANFVMKNVPATLPSIRIDENAVSILRNYENRKTRLQAKGFYLGKPPLSILTSSLHDRQETDYSNFDFYTNRGLSAWRPDVTIDPLRKNSRFRYKGKRIVLSFHESNGLVEVKTINMEDRSVELFKTKKLLIACGATGTARIVARSVSFYNQPIPLLCNPYQYITAVQTSRLGKVGSPNRLSTAQLSIIYSNGSAGDDGMGSVYSYDALPMSSVLKQVPLGFADARVLMQYLLPAMVITGVHHPDRFSDKKSIQLDKNDSSPTGDAIHIRFELTPMEKNKIAQRLRAFRGFLRSVGCTPVKTVYPPNGASIHYAGTLPFDQTKKPLTTHSNGRLSGTDHVYIADSSPFCFLPAKGLTFTIMANAHRTALQLLKNE